MAKLSLGVIFGGCSEERLISVKSAREIAKHLDRRKYELRFVGIRSDGAWRLCGGPDTDWEGGEGRVAVLGPDRAVGGLLVKEQGGWETIRLDVVVPVLHGKLGEDGAIQGLLELSGIPYVGCGIQSSALCMDKSLAYLVARNAGIATPTFWTCGPNDVLPTGQLSYPVFVKPARSGSSFGVSRVTESQQLPDAVSIARQYDSKVLIEEAVDGCEVGCAVLGNGATLTVGEPDRIALSHGFFRIHQEEHPETGSENSSFVVPADIPAESRLLVQQTAMTLYRAFGCRGLARVDLFLKRDGEVVLNEINTFPGMTSYSRYPRMMAAAGLAMTDVLDRLVTLALDER